MNEDEIGQCVRMALAKAGMNQADLAKKMNISRQAISQYAKGKCKNILILEKIAYRCDMTLVEMMGLAE